MADLVGSNFSPPTYSARSPSAVPYSSKNCLVKFGEPIPGKMEHKEEFV